MRSDAPRHPGKAAREAQSQDVSADTQPFGAGTFRATAPTTLLGPLNDIWQERAPGRLYLAGAPSLMRVGMLRLDRRAENGLFHRTSAGPCRRGVWSRATRGHTLRSPWLGA